MQSFVHDEAMHQLFSYFQLNLEYEFMIDIKFITKSFI